MFLVSGSPCKRVLISNKKEQLWPGHALGSRYKGLFLYPGALVSGVYCTSISLHHWNLEKQDEIQKITESHKAPEINGLPRFYGGYVGFFAYESAQYAEKKIAKLQSKDSKFKDHMPEIFLVKADKLIIYDNINKSTQVIFNANPSKFSYEDALDEIKTIVTSLQNEADNLETSFKEPRGLIDFDSNFTKEGFIVSHGNIFNTSKS